MSNAVPRAESSGRDEPRYVLAALAWTMDSPAEPRAQVALAIGPDGQIEAVFPAAELPSDADPATCDILLPGLLNSHCHLEYTHLRGALPRGAKDFGHWIEAITATRRPPAGMEPAEHAAALDLEAADAARSGARQLLAGGCTAVLDTVGSLAADAAARESPLRRGALWELLGLTDARAAGVAATAAQGLARPGKPGCPAAGLNPHAPYSVGLAARAWAARWLLANPDRPFAWHLGETSDEIDLFARGEGGLAEFLDRAGLPRPFDGAAPGMHPAEWLAAQGLLPPDALVFHGNLMPPAWLAEGAGAGRTVVHCPGTHLYFRRPPFPLAALRAAGFAVALGTDSAASADTLDMLEVLRLAAAAFPGLPAQELLAMATTIPAATAPFEPLGLGTLTPGAPADMVLVNTPRLPEGTPPGERLLHPDAVVVATVIGGRVVHRRRGSVIGPGS